MGGTWRLDTLHERTAPAVAWSAPLHSLLVLGQGEGGFSMGLPSLLANPAKGY